jgi:Ca2+-binding EF-hand superfamily protein
MASNAPYEAQASTNYKEAFALFDKRGNGRVALDSLGDLLRACGQNPTLAEIRDLEKNVGSDCEFSFALNLPDCIGHLAMSGELTEHPL